MHPKPPLELQKSVILPLKERRKLNNYHLISNSSFFPAKYSQNKIEGTPILKLAMVKRLKVEKIRQKTKILQRNSLKNSSKNSNSLKKFVEKIRWRNSSKKFVKKIRQIVIFNKELQENSKGLQSNEFYVQWLPFMTQSRFLEAPLVRQADGELKNTAWSEIWCYTSFLLNK